MPPADDRSLPPEAIVALQQGNKIEAIKHTREHYGLGLKEAKDRVERYVSGQPALQQALEDASGRGRGTVLLLLVAIAIAAIVGYLLAR